MYLNQKALWAKVIDAQPDQFGDIKTSNEETLIAVRRQEHVEEIRLRDGTIHKTNYIYYTHDDVHLDDRLDGNLVVQLYDMRTLGGRNRLRRLITI